jgi:hypothetical protein
MGTLAAMNALDSFRRAYTPDPQSSAALGWSAGDTRALLGSEPRDFTEFVTRVARDSYGNGLFRCLLPNGQPSLVDWNQPGGWRTDWADLPRLIVWATDWLGRMWCFDLDHKVKGEPSMVRVEPGMGTWSEMDMKFGDFIGRELGKYREDLLSEEFYRDWLAAGGAVPRPDQCVGYRIPPMLGGEDDVPNLEISDLMVYVSLTGQLGTQTADLEPGTRIDSVTLR